MLITDERLARLKKTGYTYYIQYQKWLDLAECWTWTGFPACDDSIAIHREALESGRMDDIRYVSVIKL